MSTLTAQAVSRSPLRQFATAHPIADFMAITLVVAYPAMFVVALAAHGHVRGGHLLAELPVPPDEVAGLLLTLGALLPAAGYVTWATDGRPGIIRLFRRILRWRFGVRWWLVILIALPLLTVGSGLLLGDSPRPVDLLVLARSQILLLLVNLLLVNLWEEAAWAGVMQTRLECRHNLFVAALLTAVPFALVHWPLALFEHTVSVGSVLTALPGYLLLGILVRPLLGLTLRATGNSLLGVALVHSMVNRTQNNNGIAVGLLDGQGHQLGFLVALVIMTGVLTLLLRGKLNQQYRHRLDGTATA